MKTKFKTTLFFLICISNLGYSQFKTDNSFNNADKNLKHKFYEIITSNTELNISNLASINTKDSKIELKGSIKISDNILLNMGVNGAINEGVSSILSGLEIVPSVGTELGFHLYIDDNDYYSKIVNQFSFKEKQDSLIREREFRVLKFVDLYGNEITYNASKPAQTLIESKGKIIPYFMYLEYMDQNDKIIKKKEFIIKLNKEIESHKKAINDGFITKDKKQITLTNQDLEILKRKVAMKAEKIKVAENDISNMEEVLQEYLSVSNVISNFEVSENNYVEAMKKTYELKQPEEYRISWISLNGSLKNNSIKLFDESVIFEDQISKNSFNNFGVELSYNIYNLTVNDHKTYFLRLGFSYNNKDNLGDLSALKIEQVDNISNSSGTSSRISKSEIAAYKKEEYKSDINSTSLFVDGYWFFSRKNNTALHLRTEVVSEGGTQKMNLGTGLFLSFKTKNKENPFVNVELFTNFADLLKDNTEEDKLLDRSTTSLSLNFPITFKTNQK